MHRDDRQFWLNPAVTVETAPANSPVTLDDVKLALRIDGTSDDAFLQGEIDAVTGELDGPHGWLGRCLITQTLRLTLDYFPDHVPHPARNLVKPLPNNRGRRIYLPFPPLQTVDAVKYTDEDGQEQTLDSSRYRVVADAHPYGYIELNQDETWPPTDDIGAAVQIDYTAGYGDDASAVPERVKTYIKARVAARDQARSAVHIGSSIEHTPYVDNILTGLRVRTKAV
jgi:uncharacterized phiE125 gp8 family phage protein